MGGKMADARCLLYAESDSGFHAASVDFFSNKARRNLSLYTGTLPLHRQINIFIQTYSTPSHFPEITVASKISASLETHLKQGRSARGLRSVAWTRCPQSSDLFSFNKV